MKIDYITTYDATDVSSWSGLGFQIANSLKKQDNELHLIGGLQQQTNKILDLKLRFYRRLLKQKFLFEREPYVAKQYARQIEPRLSNADVLFSPGSLPVALLESKTPKVIYTDATFARMLNFYPFFTGLCSETIRHGNYLERQALQSSALAIFSSKWAADSAVKDYGLAQKKVHVVPFGANIESTRSLEDIKAIVASRSKSECHLLFLGVDWKRKGGDMALRVAETLNQMGLKTTLHVAGVKGLEKMNLPHFLKDHGFIGKETKAGREKLDTLLAMSHFLILPTQADCTPVVFSEANSFGLPIITTDVGGIGSIVTNDVNGRTFPLTATAGAYADYIHNAFTRSDFYQALCLASFGEYEMRLNWNTAGQTITKLIRRL